MEGFEVIGDLTYEDYDGTRHVTVEQCQLCYGLTTYPSAHMEWHTGNNGPPAYASA